jgi:hypothetical protein
MSAAAGAPTQGLTVADRQIIARVAPHIAAVLSQLPLDDIALFVVQQKDMSDLVPSYQDVPGFARGIVRARLASAGDLFFGVLFETTRNLLRPQYPGHAALLGRPQAAAWYRANMERMRDGIMQQMGARA